MKFMGNVEKYKGFLESVKCNVCGADDPEIIYPARYELAKPDNINESFRSSGDEILIDPLVRCRKCGLQYLTPRLRQDVIIQAYSEGSDEVFVAQAKGREKTFARSFDVIDRFYPGKGTILDVGTAGGSFLSVAKRNGWKVLGCEPNRWMVKWCKENYGIDVHPGTLFDMKLPSESVDVVTLWDVLEHTPDPTRVLEECRRILKPGGIMVVNYPDIGAWVSRLMGRKWVFLLSVHLYYFTPGTIRAILKKTGFETLLFRPHWQTLEYDYICTRIAAYAAWLSSFGKFMGKLLHLSGSQIPYWVGQTLVVARKIQEVHKEKIQV